MKRVQLRDMMERMRVTGSFKEMQNLLSADALAARETEED